MSLVLTDVTDRVVTITLNDPDRRNVLSLELNAELINAVEEAENDPEVRALVITGAPPAFCAGADLDDLLAHRNHDELRTIYAGFLRLAHSTLPTIAAVNGAAVGAGSNTALACDVIMAGRSARFDSRFLQLAIHPGGGHTWRLRNITNLQTVKAMVLFGQVLSGEDAARIGLAWEVVDDAELLPRCQEMAARAASYPKELVARTKATIAATSTIETSDAAVDLEVDPQVWSMTQPDFDDFVSRVKNRITSS